VFCYGYVKNTYVNSVNNFRINRYKCVFYRIEVNNNVNNVIKIKNGNNSV